MMETVAPLTGAATTSERGWRGFVLALALVLASALLAVWPPALGLLAAVVALLGPLPEPLVLLTTALAACALAAWSRGGRLALALIWVLLAVWALATPPATGTAAFDEATRAWALAAGCGFGFAHLVAAGRRFLSRALVAVGVATLVAGASLALRGVSPGQAQQLAAGAIGTRVGGAIARWRDHQRDPVWQRFAQAQPALADRAATAAARLEAAVPAAARLAPALLATETLLILAVAWAAFHRLSRTRLGAPLAPLARLRFNDQLVWGVIVGGVLTLLPTFVEWRLFGLNLLLFFGGLYALRGVGVLAGTLSDRTITLLALAALALSPFAGAGTVLATLAGVAMLAGLSDTWRDWRGLTPLPR
jgi:hypothetical protein